MAIPQPLSAFSVRGIASILLLVMLLAIPGETQAGSFFFKRRVNLPNAELYEMGLSGEGVSVALAPLETDASWDDGTLITPDMPLDQVYSTGRIQRRDVLLWYYTYNHNSEKQPVFNVRYRVLSKSGVENAFSHQKDAGSLILANITGKPVECEKKNKNKSRCFGRADLDLDITGARKSGKYFGTIEITITSY